MPMQYSHCSVQGSFDNSTYSEESEMRNRVDDVSTVDDTCSSSNMSLDIHSDLTGFSDCRQMALFSDEAMSQFSDPDFGALFESTQHEDLFLDIYLKSSDGSTASQAYQSDQCYFDNIDHILGISENNSEISNWDLRNRY